MLRHILVEGVGFVCCEGVCTLGLSLEGDWLGGFLLLGHRLLLLGSLIEGNLLEAIGLPHHLHLLQEKEQEKEKEHRQEQKQEQDKVAIPGLRTRMFRSRPSVQ